MKVLVVGKMGYVGPVRTRHLRQAYPQVSLIGFDAGVFLPTGSRHLKAIQRRTHEN